MVRYAFSAAAALLMFCPAAKSDGPAQPQPAKAQVTVRALVDDPAHEKLVLVRMPKTWEDELKVMYRRDNGTSGEYGKFGPDVTASLPVGVGRLERRYDGEEVVYTLYILTGDKASYEVTVGDELFKIPGAKAPLGAVAAVPAPPPIPWHTFYASTKRTWSAEAKRRALEASVRVVTPAG